MGSLGSRKTRLLLQIKDFLGSDHNSWGTHENTAGISRVGTDRGGRLPAYKGSRGGGGNDGAAAAKYLAGKEIGFYMLESPAIREAARRPRASERVMREVTGVPRDLSPGTGFDRHSTVPRRGARNP